MPENKFWFRARKYGWGWTPITWQGWLSIAVFVIVMILGSLILLDVTHVSLARLAAYFVWTFASVFTLLFISYKKGPAPSWHWGNLDETDR